MGWTAQYFTQIIIVGAQSGIFIYSPTPGAGNLIGSWAAMAGTDQFGNAYPEGINVEQGTISGTTTMFFYNPTPAAGNLYYSLTESTGTDAFGNAYLAGQTFYGQPVAGTWIAVNSGINSSAQGILYYTATSSAGPWSIDSWVRRSGSNTGQLEIGPIIEQLSTGLLPATPTAGAKYFTPSTTTTPRVMKLDGEPGYGIGETIYTLPALQTISAGWAVPLAAGGTSLSVPVQSGIQYYFEGTFFTQDLSATTTQLLGFTGPAVSQCNWFIHTQAGSTNPLTGGIGTGWQSTLTHVSVAVAGASDVAVCQGWGTFTPSANGTFSMAAGQGNSLNFTVLAGTFLKVRTVH